MNYLLPNATSEDAAIQQLQQRMYGKLCSIWGVNDSNYNSFGRAYRNYNDKGYLPEWYDPTTKQYVDGTGQNTRGGLFFEDSLAAVSYYGLTDPIKNMAGISSANVQLLFFVDLTKITPGGLSTEQQAGQRLDTVALNDVRNFIESAGCGFELREIYRDVDKVTERYPGYARNSTLNRNMDNFLCFRIDMLLRFNPLLNTSKYLP